VLANEFSVNCSFPPRVMASQQYTTLRLSLDKDIMDQSDVFLKPIDTIMPSNVWLRCKCGYQVTSEIQCTVNSPSTHWYESIDLWNCHDENWQTRVTEEQGKLKIAHGRAVLNCTTIDVNASTMVAKSTGKTFECTGCKKILGIMPYSDQYRILLDRCTIMKLENECEVPVKLDLYQTLLNTLRSAYDENFTKDLYLKSLDSENAIFIKILSVDTFL